MPIIKERYQLKALDILQFQTENSGYYVVKIQAKAKSEKQRNNTDDDEITVKIDALEFPKPNTQNGLTNSPASFNGGKLHNKEQIIYFIIYLKTGNHTIKLTPQHGDGAEVQEVSCEEISIKNNQIALNLNKQLEDRDKQPWITFVLVNIGLKFFIVETSVKWHWLDGDDIKIIINDEIQQATTKFRKDWIIKTNPLNIFGKTETVQLTPNLPIQNYNYIGFYADKTPTLKSINFELTTDNKQPQIIQKYKDEKFGRDYNKLDEYILSAVNYWNDFFSKQQYPPPKLLDPNLVKAMIYRESTLGYDKDNNGEVDVMQVWNPLDPAQATLTGKTPESEFIDRNTTELVHNTYPSNMVPNVSTAEESIFWGVRWLYHKAQEYIGVGENFVNPPFTITWLSWKDAIYNYNASDNVDEYVKEVFSVYEKGIDLEGDILWE